MNHYDKHHGRSNTRNHHHGHYVDEEQLGCNGYPSNYPLRSYCSDGWNNSHCMDMRFGPFRFDEQMEVSGQYTYLHCQGYAYISIPIIQLFGHGFHGEDDQSTVQRSY
jgi:hypothetical protein